MNIYYHMHGQSCTEIWYNAGMLKIIRKADIVLFIILVLIGAALFAFAALGGGKGGIVVVRVKGDVVGTYSLAEDRILIIEQSSSGSVTVTESDTADSSDLAETGSTELRNMLEIKDGKVNMLFSTCKNQICVEHSEIDSTNESIVCLPNRVSIEITGKAGEDDIDAVS